MKDWIGAVVLAVLCLGLGIALVVVKKQARDQQRKDADKIGILSNKWVKTSADLEEQRKVSDMFEKDLDSQRKQFVDLTNNFSRLSANLSQTAANLAQTEASLKTTQEEVKQREAKIAELENQNQALDKRGLELSTAITNLTMQIADTKKKLAASEGNRAELEAQLKRLLAEKSELERQFNDLTVLRAQVAKLKEELSIARRLEWIRRGLFASAEQKGAQQLMQGGTVATKNPRPNYELNVEVGADGTARVISSATNSAASTNSPPK